MRIGDGSERYTPSGETYIEHSEPGEVIFSDETGLGFARRWCHRQSDESATREDTTYVLFTIQAYHQGGAADVYLAVAELLDLIYLYVEGELQTA